MAVKNKTQIRNSSVPPMGPNGSQQWSIIENKKTDAVSAKKKDYAWERIASNFNSQNETFRTQESLKNLWDNIKKKC